MGICRSSCIVLWRHLQGPGWGFGSGWQFRKTGAPKPGLRSHEVLFCPTFRARSSVSFFSADCKRGRRAGGKGPRQKTSKIAKKCQKVFRHFSTIFARCKKRQKSSKSVKKFFDTFRQFSRGTFFPAPFGGL